MYSLRACQKTPTINLGTYPDVRRIYPINIPIGNIAVPIRRKLTYGMLSTEWIFVCTFQTGLRYLRVKSLRMYWVFKNSLQYRFYIGDGRTLNGYILTGIHSIFKIKYSIGIYSLSTFCL